MKAVYQKAKAKVHTLGEIDRVTAYLLALDLFVIVIAIGLGIGVAA